MGILKVLSGVVLLASVATPQTTTMIDYLSQIRNKPNLINPTFTNVTAAGVTSGWLNANGIYVGQTSSGSGGVGGYLQITPTTYPNTLCVDQFGNVVNQPVGVTGLPAVNAANDAVIWVSESPLSGTTPPGCLQTPFSQQQDYGLNVSTYVFSLVGFATNRAAFNSFDSLSGGMHAVTMDVDAYVNPGEFTSPLSTGPADPWRRLSVVNTSGTAVTLVSGAVFFSGLNAPPFGYININGTQYTVVTVIDPQHLTLGGSAGTQTGVNAYVPGWGSGAISYSTASGCLSLYSVGSWSCLGGGAGGVAPPVNSVQFNGSGVLSGSSNFGYDSGAGRLTVCATLGGACTVNSGVDAQSFSSSATGGQAAFVTNGGLTTIINGAGAVTPQTLAVGSGVFTVNGAGDTAVHNLNITGTCFGCSAATAAGSNTQVQYNNSGAFGASTNFTFVVNTGTSNTNLNVCTVLAGNCGLNSGFNGQAFSSSATGSQVGFTDVGANFTILGSGQGNFSSLNAGSGNPFIVTNAGDTSVHNLTINGTCIGCNSSPAGANTQVQFNNAGVFGGNANFTFVVDTVGHNSNLSVCTFIGGNCGLGSGFNAQAFSSSATGSQAAFVTNGGLTTIINGAGAVTPQTLAVGSGSPFTVNGAGAMVVNGVTDTGVMTVAGTGTLTAAGNITILDASTTPSIAFNSSGPTRQATIAATSTAAQEVVGSDGTNKWIVLQTGGLRAPGILGGSGGNAVCADSSNNIYKSTSTTCP